MASLTRSSKLTVRFAGGYPALWPTGGSVPLPDMWQISVPCVRKSVGRIQIRYPGRSGAGDLGGDAQTGALRETDASQAADCPHAGIACARQRRRRPVFHRGISCINSPPTPAIHLCLYLPWPFGICCAAVGTLCQIMLPRSPAVVAHRIFQYFAFSSDTPVVPALAAVIHPVVFPLTIT